MTDRHIEEVAVCDARRILVVLFGPWGCHLYERRAKL